MDWLQDFYDSMTFAKKKRAASLLLFCPPRLVMRAPTFRQGVRKKACFLLSLFWTGDMDAAVCIPG